MEKTYFPKVNKDMIVEELSGKDPNQLNDRQMQNRELDIDVAEVNDVLTRAKANANIGVNIPPMYKMHGIKRFFANIIAKTFLRISEIITRDQRIVNQLLIDASSLLSQQLSNTNQQTAQTKQTIENLIKENNKLKSEVRDLKNTVNRLHYINELEQDQLYVDFENVFRGSREDIKGRLKIYLSTIEESIKSKETCGILDLGCGRGEWIELLKENGYKAKGIDMNQVMIQLCKDLGLDVELNDAFNYLSQLEDSSLGLVTGFHLIEHLPYEKQIKLIDEIFRVLKPNGLMVLETPNPQNILVGSGTFFIDPTHVKPMFPDTLRFLAEKRGFKNVEIKLLNPLESFNILEDSIVAERMNKHFYGPQDFAVVGWKI